MSPLSFNLTGAETSLSLASAPLLDVKVHRRQRWFHRADVDLSRPCVCVCVCVQKCKPCTDADDCIARKTTSCSLKWGRSATSPQRPPSFSLLPVCILSLKKPRVSSGGVQPPRTPTSFSGWRVSLGAIDLMKCSSGAGTQKKKRGHISENWTAFEILQITAGGVHSTFLFLCMPD